MSAPRFKITLFVPGTSLKFTMSTSCVLGEDPEAVADDLKDEIMFRFCSNRSKAFLGNLENEDLKALRTQWSDNHQQMILGMETEGRGRRDE